VIEFRSWKRGHRLAGDEVERTVLTPEARVTLSIETGAGAPVASLGPRDGVLPPRFRLGPRRLLLLVRPPLGEPSATTASWERPAGLGSPNALCCIAFIRIVSAPAFASPDPARGRA